MIEMNAPKRLLTIQAGLKPIDAYEVVFKGLEPFFFFYLPVQLRKVLRCLVFNAAGYGYHFCRALHRTYAASDAPIQIDLRLIVNHFYRIHRANVGAGPAADAFT